MELDQRSAICKGCGQTFSLSGPHDCPGPFAIPRFLLIKRGLYYRPDNSGYTGIKEHAGRYHEADASPDSGVTAIHEDEAPEFSAACFEDLKVAHLQAKLDALAKERDAYRALAIREGWSHPLAQAYGREEYQASREAEVDRMVAGWIEKGVVIAPKRPAAQDQLRHSGSAGR